MEKIYNSLSNFFRGRGLSKYGFLKKLDSAIRRMVGKRPEDVIFRNGHIIFDPCFAFQESAEPFEPFTSKLVGSLLKPGGVFVDVGANIGWFALIAARAVGETGKVYAFEPHPSAFKTLVKNAEINGYSNIVPFRSAVADYDGEISLFLLAERWDWSTTTMRVQYGYTEKNSVKVPVTSLDSALSGNKQKTKINLLKMDIEGGEMAALNGMKKIIHNNPGIAVISEFTYFDSDEGYAYLNEWGKLGFSIYRINEKKRKLVPQTVEEVVHTPMSIRVHSTNILLKR